MEELREKLSGLLIARGRRRWRTRFMRVVAIVVVFVTTYTMVMPALTLDENTVETAAGISLDEGKSEKKAETKKSKKKSKKKSSKKKSEKKEETEDDSAIKPAADKVKAKIGGAELTISYSKKAGLPKDVSVVVTEYSPNSDDKDNRAAYDAYFAMAQKKALDKGADEVTLARFFALQFFAGDQELVPEEGVKISVKYKKSLKLADDETYRAVQFGKDSAKLLKTTTKGDRKLTKASFTLKKFPGLGLIVTRKEAETEAPETEAKEAEVKEAEAKDAVNEKKADEPEVITEAPQEEVKAAGDAEPAKKEIVTQAPEEGEESDGGKAEENADAEEAPAAEPVQEAAPEADAKEEAAAAEPAEAPAENAADQADAEPAEEVTVETADITEAAIALAGITFDALPAEKDQAEVSAEKAAADDEPAEEANDEEADKKDSEDEQAAEDADAEDSEDGLTSEVISDIEDADAADAENGTDEMAGETTAEDAAADESSLEETTAEESAAEETSEVTAEETAEESALAETTVEETTAEETTAEETTIEETTEEAVEEEVYEAGELTYDADGYKVVLSYSAEAKIPADATLSVREIQEGSAEYEAYRAQAEAAVAADPEKEIAFARAFDIKIQAPVEVEVEAAADAEAGEAAEAQGPMTETVIREIQPAVPVSVQILLDEPVEVAPADEVKALHVETNDGTAGISAAGPEVTAINDVDYDAAAEGEAPAEVKEVEFKADGFSAWMVVGTTPGVEIPMVVGTTELIEPELSTGYNSYSWETSDRNIVSIESGKNTKDVTVKAVAEGTAQLTLTYVSGTGKKARTYKAYYTIVADALTDEESTAQAYTDGNMTVTVKETGNLKKLSDYHVVVEDADGEFTDDDVLKAYHIYLADSENVEVDSSTLGNGTLNLKVTITYNEEPEWFADAKTVGHYKNGKEQSISALKFDAAAKSISFIVHGFSSFVIRSNTTNTTAGGVAVTTQQGSILDGVTFNDANEWQIVSEEYSNNTGVNKTNYGDDTYHALRVQKNVIPTGVENEFYVYLSVDTKELLREWLKYATYNKASQNNWGQGTWKVGDVVPSMPSHESTFTGNPDAGWEWYSNVNVLDPDGNIILHNLPIYSSQSQNNATVFLDIQPYGYVLFGRSVDKTVHNADGVPDNQCRLGEEAYEHVQEFIANMFSLNTVTDAMGATLGGDIEFLGVVDGDYTSEPTYADGVLTWNPVMKDNPVVEQTGTGDNIQRWYMNVAELLYKVRLNVTADGFNSCADNMDSEVGDPESYPVNESASINYTVKVGNGTIPGTATFQKPYVRGMLYDIQVKKVDQDGNALPGVQFTLTGTSANTGANIASTEASAIAETSLITGADGFVNITELPWGTYTLTEIPPDGYSAEQTTFTAELCHTTNEANLSASSIDPAREMLTSWKPYLTIVNKRNLIEVEKQVIIDKTLDPDFDEASVDQTIYIALWDANTNDYLTGADGKILVKAISIQNGAVTGQGTSSNLVTFGVDEALPNHTYYVSELVKTADVNPDDISRIQPGDYADDDHEYVYGLSNLTFIGTDSNGNEAVFQMKTPIGHEWNYDTGAYNEGSGRTADLSGANNEARVRFDNTYTPETMIEFVAQKQWGRRTIAEDGTWGMAPLPEDLLPEDASVTITLYQRIAGGGWNTYRTITLNGEVDSDGEDAAWRAVFKDLPKFDTVEGSPTFGEAYEYRANETAKPDEFEPFDAVSDHVPMGQHGNDADDYIKTGGIIYNIQKTTEITVKKVDENGAFLRGASFKLMGPDLNNHESLIKEFEITSEAGVTIGNLVSGDYKLVETAAPDGYIILTNTIEFSVNAIPATGENVITWKGGAVPANVSEESPTTTTNAGDTITVVNTPGVALPNTGGPGTLPYTLSGLALMLASAMMYGFSLRRRERRYE